MYFAFFFCYSLFIFLRYVKNLVVNYLDLNGAQFKVIMDYQTGKMNYNLTSDIMERGIDTTKILESKEFEYWLRDEIFKEYFDIKLLDTESESHVMTVTMKFGNYLIIVH